MKQILQLRGSVQSRLKPVAPAFSELLGLSRRFSGGGLFASSFLARNFELWICTFVP
jgi:hypothetical protein